MTVSPNLTWREVLLPELRSCSTIRRDVATAGRLAARHAGTPMDRPTDDRDLAAVWRQARDGSVAA